ncbi:hypothetical protein P692DRAFT_201811395 [Suillus brevipes Sb2]|nr:hypothetical protein P692DRAFT_201811395 [Suillus brevipes Sb2]
MQQSLRQTQTFNLSGNIISDLLTLFPRIEITGNANQKSEHEGLVGVSLSYTSKADIEKSSALAENKEVLHLPEHIHERCEEESIAKLKEQLRLAELGCSRLQAQYQVYRLRWLEEYHRARIFEEYVPIGVSTCSPRQIEWDAPSPIQFPIFSDNDDDVEWMTTLNG